MLQKLIDLNPELKSLQQKGLSLQVENNYLIIDKVYYFNSSKRLQKDGCLIIQLNLTGDAISPQPADHVALFKGDEPCNQAGNPLNKLVNGKDISQVITPSLSANFSFSNKPLDYNFKTYYEKALHYINILSQHQSLVDIPQTNQNITDDNNQVVKNNFFQYADTSSARYKTGKYQL